MPTASWTFLCFLVREMIGTTRTFRLTFVIGISVVLLPLGLVNRDLVHCSRLDPGHHVALSNYFEARGFPFVWLATTNGTCGDVPGIPGRILLSELLRSFAFCVVAATVAGFLLHRRGRMRRARVDTRASFTRV